MYHRRFQNRNARYLFEIKGGFSLLHLGGPRFMYSFPQKNRSGYTVGRFDVPAALQRHLHGIAFLMVAALVFGAYTFFADSGVASSASKSGQTETSPMVSEVVKTSKELDQKTEEMKQKILAMDENSSDTKNYYHYTVKKGDTLASISKSLGVRADQVAASSGIKSYDSLKPGQKLTIPEKKGVVYTLKKGDTLAGVAEYYSVTIDDIKENNSGDLDVDMPTAGTVVFLPNARVPVIQRAWIMPAFGRLTSGFGRRRHPLYGYYQKHTGIDIGISYAFVKAARSGEVIFAGSLGNYGNAVIVKHASGFKTLYAHLSRILVSSGSKVVQGGRLAISGNSGMSTGPHLHFELIKDGKPINPLRYVRF